MNETYSLFLQLDISRLFNWFVIKRTTRRVPYVDQDMLTLPEQLISHPILWGS